MDKKLLAFGFEWRTLGLAILCLIVGLKDALTGVGSDRALGIICLWGSGFMTATSMVAARIKNGTMTKE